MKNSSIQFALAAVLSSHLALACTTPRRVGVRESQSTRSSLGGVPEEEAAATLRDFISYTLRRKPELFQDEIAQRKFLTEDLRNGVAHHWRIYQEYIKEHETPTSPDNGTFVGAWEFPSGYTIKGGRQSGDQIIIDVLFKWDNPQANYYGDTRDVSYTFSLEDGAWKLHDMYTHQGKFIGAYSLREKLWRKDYE